MEPPEPLLLSLILMTLQVIGLQASVFGIILVVLLLMSALISGSEVAFFSISPQQLEGIKKSTSGKDSLVLKLIAKPEKLLATILVANNFINIAIVTISTFLLKDLLIGTGLNDLTIFIIEIVLVTFVILLFGEVSTENIRHFF